MGRWASGLLILLLVLGLLGCLQDFGPTWDLHQTLFYGERYYQFFSTGDARYLDFSGGEVPAYRAGFDVEQSHRQGATSPAHFVWPLSYTLAAASQRLFTQTLQMLSPVAGYHAVNVLLAAALAWFGATLLRRRIAGLAGFAFPLVLLLAPAFFGNVAQNLRDVPSTCFLGMTLCCVPAFFERPGPGKALLLGLLLGLGLSCKVTALAAVGSASLPLLWLFWSAPRQAIRVASYGALAVLVAGVVFVLLWPWLWGDGLDLVGTRLRLHVNDFLLRQYRPTTGWDWTPILEVVGTTPPLLLGLLVVGLVRVCCGMRQDQAVLSWLLLGWFFLPILRICMPGFGNYGGIRHFLEFWPAAAALMSVGLVQLVRWCPRPGWFVAAATGACLWPLVVSHPLQTSYNNWLVGFNRGGLELGLSSSLDYWGSSLALGEEWVSSQAQESDLLWAPVGQHLLAHRSLPGATLPLQRLPAEAAASPTSAWVLVLVRRSLAEHVKEPALYEYCRNEQEPVFEIRRGGLALLQVYHAAASEGGARGFLQRAHQWFAPQSESLARELEATLRRQPEEFEALVTLYSLRKQQGYCLQLDPLMRPFVDAAIAALPEDQRQKYRGWWHLEQKSARGWRGLFERSARDLQVLLP